MTAPTKTPQPAPHHPHLHLPAPRFVPRTVGPLTIWALVAALALLWWSRGPAGVPGRSSLGQLVGAEAVLLMSVGLVLISTLQWVEPYFDGIDRAAVWHRWVMITGMVLLLPHVLLASNPSPTAAGPALGVVGLAGLLVLSVWTVLPRWQALAPAQLRDLVVHLEEHRWAQLVTRFFGGYEVWRAFHRTTGLFVAAGVLHGLLDGTAFDDQVLRWTYVVVGAVGLLFYVYREVLARYVSPLHDYQVAAVEEVQPGLVELSFRPLGHRFAFVPGQFAILYLEGKGGWHRHPFSITSGAHEELVRVTVKALGDFTSRIQDLVEPGMPAVIGGAHGRFDHRKGGPRQVWVAGGVGIAPFLSWLRSARPGGLHDQVDFFYSGNGPAPFEDELRAIGDAHPELRVHLVDTTVEGRLTPDRVLEVVQAEPRSLSVFTCGPEPMLATFQTELRRAGVKPSRIHREYFDLR